MFKVEEATGGLDVYLKQENEIADKSQTQWSAELELFLRLANLYIRLNTLAKIKDLASDTPANLFLAVQSQMYGAVSRILRRRIADAEAATRRSIEAAATAYRLSKHPKLLKIYTNAFVRAESEGVWKPSKEYTVEFSTDKLFSEPKEFWDTLKTDYAMFSAMSSHAGLGITASHLTIDGQRVLPFFESDDKNMYRCWYHQIAVYWSILRVFLAVLRRTAEGQMIRIFEDEMLQWQKLAAQRLNERVPWMEATAKAKAKKKMSSSLSSLIIIPR